jgi:hypothetical protein
MAINEGDRAKAVTGEARSSLNVLSQPSSHGNDEWLQLIDL